MTKKQCLNCGEVFVEKSQNKLFCSSRCRVLYWYHNHDTLNCESDQVTRCEYCGTEFNNHGNQTRKYCCRAHYFAVRFGLDPNTNYIEDATREQRMALVMKMRSEGIIFADIAEALGMSLNTVKSWVQRYGYAYHVVFEDCSEKDEEETPQSIEICELPAYSMRRIFLMSGMNTFKGKIDCFAAQIPGLLSYNLQTGDAFVFCNKSRYQIGVLQWQGDGFALMFRRTEQERYPWPYFGEPKAVEITRSDLEILMEYPRFMRRLRGLATPEMFA